MQIGGKPFIAFENSFFSSRGSLTENVSLEKNNGKKEVSRENTFIWSELEFGFKKKAQTINPNMANIKW